MRTTNALLAVLAATMLAGCQVKVKEEGKLPDVDVRKTPDGGAEVKVKPGEIPDVEVSRDSSIAVPEVKTPRIEPPHVKLPEVGDTTRRDTARRP